MWSSEGVRDTAFSIGYNVLTGKYEDLIAAGIIDPAKVVRSSRSKRRFYRRYGLNYGSPRGRKTR
jgi:hypothetical protein